ncbi:MAG: 2-methylcitrate dehydratase PrpD, partial [Gammaproteobacteria bacterium]
MNATALLAEFIADTTYKDLPPGVVDAAKVAIMDGVVNMVAGSTQELSRIIGEYVKELGGAPTSSVIGWGFKTNAPSAAFANGVFGHCLDFEIQGFPPTHGTSSCLPSALALGESLQAAGETIITAYVLGWEIQGRLRAASAHANNPSYHPPGLVGPLGGAAASAKVLGLNADEVHMALGIAASRTGGLTANTGTMVKSTHPGNAARMGAEAAMLARLGYTATENILETRHGYADALFGGDMHWDVVTQGLGDNYRLVDPGFHIKRFPAQIHMQNPTEAVLNLRAKHALSLDQVQSLHIHTDSRGHSGSLPRSGLDGKFSLEYCTAAALLDGKVNMLTFTDERRFAADMQEMLTKVTVDTGSQSPDLTVATATLHDGRTVSETCEGYTGAASKPMNRELRFDKMRDCLQLVHNE